MLDELNPLRKSFAASPALKCVLRGGLVTVLVQGQVTLPFERLAAVLAAVGAFICRGNEGEKRK